METIEEEAMEKVEEPPEEAEEAMREEVEEPPAEAEEAIQEEATSSQESPQKEEEEEPQPLSPKPKARGRKPTQKDAAPRKRRTQDEISQAKIDQALKKLEVVRLQEQAKAAQRAAKRKPPSVRTRAPSPASSSSASTRNPSRSPSPQPRTPSPPSYRTKRQALYDSWFPQR